jgi:hypothetical protein
MLDTMNNTYLILGSSFHNFYNLTFNVLGDSGNKVAS